MNHIAIRNVYPEVITIIEGEGCYDINNNLVEIDEEKINAEIARLDAEAQAVEYKKLRAKEYPDFREYLDGIVKGDQEQVQAYIDACLAVKAKYPKGSV